MNRRRRKPLICSPPDVLESRALLSSISVTSLKDNRADDGETTLREAFDLARDGDTIEFAIPGRIQVRLGRFSSGYDNITVRGLGPGQTIIDGQHAQALFASARTLTIEDMTLTNAKTLNDGGAINVNKGHLVVDNVHFTNNRASAGGAVYVFKGTAEISNSVFLHNEAELAGAVYMRGLDGQSIVNSRFEANHAVSAGAVYSYNRRGEGLRVANSRFTRNTAETWGGAAYRIKDSESNVFVENSAGTSGGALIYSTDTGSAFIGNTAGRDGGAVSWGSAFNATLANNHADNDGGAAYRTIIYNSTVVGNSAGGVGGGVFKSSVTSSILSGNTDRSGANDIVEPGTIIASLIGTNLGTDLVGTGSTPDADGNLIGNGTAFIDPGLMPLGDYGTHTVVAPLSPASPALNRGANIVDLTEDQRGADRVQDGAIDMGAYEGTVSSAVAVSDPRVAEDSGELVFEVSHVGTANGAFSVDVVTEGGSATTTDYTSVSRTLSFSSTGPETQEVRVPIIDDGLEEVTESVFLNVTQISDSSVARAANGTGLIENDDKPVGIVILDGLLNIRATDERDVIKVSQTELQITAVLNGEAFSTNAVEIRKVQVLGKDGNDKISVTGLKVPSLLKGGGGHDLIKAGLRDDTVLGGGGNDNIYGSAGGDSIGGGDGADTLRGQAGRDTLLGGRNSDSLLGGDSHDSIEGAEGADSIFGGKGNDTLSGGEGADLVSGETGRDDIYGGDGDNTLRGGPGNDGLTGGDGHELLVGGSGDDGLFGFGGRDTLKGLDGDDYLDGGDGADLVQAGNDRDFAVGGRGRDTLQAGNGDDVLVAGRTNFNRHYSRSYWINESRTYEQRASFVQSQLYSQDPPGYRKPTAFDDDVADSLDGGGGRDLFYVAVGTNADDLFSANTNEIKHAL